MAGAGRTLRDVFASQAFSDLGFWRWPDLCNEVLQAEFCMAIILTFKFFFEGELFHVSPAAVATSITVLSSSPKLARSMWLGEGDGPLARLEGSQLRRLRFRHGAPFPKFSFPFLDLRYIIYTVIYHRKQNIYIVI